MSRGKRSMWADLHQSEGGWRWHVVVPGDAADHRPHALATDVKPTRREAREAAKHWIYKAGGKYAGLWSERKETVNVSV